MSVKPSIVFLFAVLLPPKEENGFLRIRSLFERLRKNARRVFCIVALVMRG
jgi:hypothetical protein